MNQSKKNKAELRAANKVYNQQVAQNAVAILKAQAKRSGFAAAGNRAVMHVPVTRGNSGTVTQAPAVVGRRMQTDWNITNGRVRGSIRVRGQDWLGRILASASETPGYVYLEIYINPLEIAGTRLSLFAQLYDKFRFGLLKFHFVPAGSTQTRGTIILAYDRDISDATPPANDGGVRQFISMMDAVSSPIWAPVTAVCPLSHPEEGLWCNPVAGGDDRLAYQGQLYVACMEPSSLTPGQSLGDLFMEYDVEFFEPQLDTTIPFARVSVNGTTGYLGPSANDILRLFATGGQTNITATGIRSFQPVVGPDLRAFIELAQGVYRVITQTAQTTDGSVNIAPPTLVPNSPKPAPAPQPIVTLFNNSPTTAAGNGATADFFVAVPPGGGKLYQTLTTATGVDGTLPGLLSVEQVAPNWFNPASAFF